MKHVIILTLLMTFTLSIIIVDFSRRIIECREVNDALSSRLADLNHKYYFFPKEPGGK
jgi:hypothetical protein